MSFVDTRLYVTICPPLEHLVSSGSKQLCDVMLGDSSPDVMMDVMDRIAALVGGDDVATHTNEDGSSSPAGDDHNDDDHNDDDDHNVHRIGAAIDDVVGGVEEYLHTLCNEWMEHVRLVHTTVQRTVQSCDRQLASLSRYHDARERAAQHIHVENELETVLQRLRQSPFPTVGRPESLESKVDSLRTLMADAKRAGTRTRALVGLKRSFDRELMRVQQPLTRMVSKQWVRVLDPMTRS